MWGQASDRSDFAQLQGATLSGLVYITFGPAAVPAGNPRVDVYLDDPMRAAALTIERELPYDAFGGDFGVADLFDTATLANGAHQIEFVYSAGDETSAVSADFTVSN